MLPLCTLLVPFKQVLTLMIMSDPAVEPQRCDEFHMPMHFTVNAPELSLHFKMVPG